MATLTALDRMKRLVTLWLDRDDAHADRGSIRRIVNDFIASFDGTADVGFITAHADDRAEQITNDDLDGLGVLLHTLIECGFDPQLQERIGLDGFPAPSLRFTVRSVGRREPGWRKSTTGKTMQTGGKRARDRYRAPGAYALNVMGTTADLMPFLVAQLLTRREMVLIQRCERRLCDRFVVIDPRKRGRRSKYCRDSCIALDKEERAFEANGKNQDSRTRSKRR